MLFATQTCILTLAETHICNRSGHQFHRRIKDWRSVLGILQTKHFLSISKMS